MPEFVPGVLTVPATYTGRAVAMHFNIDNLGMTQEEATRIGLANLRRLSDEVPYHCHRLTAYGACRPDRRSAARGQGRAP
ncbi:MULTISPECIES: hypothetical protein [Kribbella]|nr:MULTISPECIES: hypothetical protein [Kribbella]